MNKLQVLTLVVIAAAVCGFKSCWKKSGKETEVVERKVTVETTHDVEKSGFYKKDNDVK